MLRMAGKSVGCPSRAAKTSLDFGSGDPPRDRSTVRAALRPRDRIESFEDGPLFLDGQMIPKSSRTMAGQRCEQAIHRGQQARAGPIRFGPKRSAGPGLAGGEFLGKVPDQGCGVLP